MSTPRERILFFGGTSDERLVSVASAQKLAPALGEATYWFLSPEGGVHPCSKQELLGHQRPFEFPFLPDAPEAFRELEPALVEAKHAGSVLVLAFHGGAEEDGRFQLECERSGVKFTGSGSASSAVAFDKQAAKRRVAGYGIPVAEEIMLVSGESPEAAIARLEREGGLFL
jgi:D-alanine-D-alanine ligase